MKQTMKNFSMKQNVSSSMKHHFRYLSSPCLRFITIAISFTFLQDDNNTPGENCE